jgi:hypothetical protein
MFALAYSQPLVYDGDIRHGIKQKSKLRVEPQATRLCTSQVQLVINAKKYAMYTRNHKVASLKLGVIGGDRTNGARRGNA